MSSRILLLMPTTTYKAEAFLDAAERLGAEVIVGTDRRQALEGQAPGHTLALDFLRPERSLDCIVALHGERPLRAVIGTDDETTELAALAAHALGLPHNRVESTRAARNKYETRKRLREAGLRCPDFRRVTLEESPHEPARLIAYPAVLKPLSLSASRGVLRANDPEEFVRAFQRIAAILRQPDARARGGDASAILIEDYIPGDEVAVEALLEAGRLRLLALFDKPDPLVGPTFEETLYITPSRLPAEVCAAIVGEAAAGCRALGLSEGPVHAELRVREGEPWLLEVAARTIGGLCSRTLRFGAGISLEELVLRHALGRDTSDLTLERSAAGVMMIPVPRAGVLREVQGLDAARGVPGVSELVISLHSGAELVPLPEGNRYLGFIFARGENPEDVERSLRASHARLRFLIK